MCTRSGDGRPERPGRRQRHAPGWGWSRAWVSVTLTLLAACGAAPTGTTPTAAPAADFTILVGDFRPGQVHPGDTTDVDLSSRFLNGFSQAVSFSLVGPAGFSATVSGCRTVFTQEFFGPPPGASCTATVRVDRAITEGTYGLVFEASAPGRPPKRTTVPLSVLPPRP